MLGSPTRLGSAPRSFGPCVPARPGKARVNAHPVPRRAPGALHGVPECALGGAHGARGRAHPIFRPPARVK